MMVQRAAGEIRAGKRPRGAFDVLVCETHDAGDYHSLYVVKRVPLYDHKR